MITRSLVYTILLFLFYGFQYLLIPGIVLYPDIKGHSFGYRVLFYQISALCYISFVSFALCYMHIYTAASTWISFVVLPVGVRLFRERRGILAAFHQWLEGYNERKTYTESFRSRMRRYGSSLRPIALFLYQNYLRGRLLHYLTCAIVIYLICAKFGYFHLTHYTYECSDEATHIYWVTSLINGNAFPVGLYPHGMHFMVGGLCIMFGLEVMKAWLCFGMVSLTVVFLSGFLFTEKVFGSKFSALAAVLLFIIGKGLGEEWFSRLNWVMPMELSMFTVFIMMYGLVCWIQDNDKKSLLMFGMGVLGTTLVHMFATIAACFVVAAFVFVFGIQMIREKRFHKFIICGILAIVLAVTPYAVGIACGYQLEQSFSWGMKIFGTNLEADEETTSDAIENPDIDSTDGMTDSTASEEPQDGTSPSTETTDTEPKVSITEKFNHFLARVIHGMTDQLVADSETAYVVLALFLFHTVFGLMGLLIAFKNKSRREYYAVILFAVLAWFTVFVVLYLIAKLGIVTIMATQRSSVYISFLMLPMIAAPFGFVTGLFRQIGLRSKYPDELAMLAVGICCIAYVIWSGEPLYKDLEYVFTLDEQDVKTEERLINDAEKNTWTLISSTNARLAIFCDGYHYEITDVLLACRDKNELYIPTKDLYIVVETRVCPTEGRKVDGSNFLEGTYDISAEDAANPLSYYVPVVNGKVDSDIYLDSFARIGIMSHFYYWMEKIKEVYPNEVSVYLQDDTCTVYHITQDPYFLLNLAVDYSDVVEEAQRSTMAE